MRSVRLPGRVAHGLAWLFTLLLTLCLTLTCLSWQAAHVLTDAGLHKSIALDSQVLSAQLARIEEKVNQLAEEYFFQPETVMTLVDEDALAEYNRQVISWWMGLFQPDAALDAPMWDTSAIEQAVRADALFMEHTAANMRRSIARDKVAYQVGLAVRRAVLPVRADILSALLPTVMERVNLPVLTQWVGRLPMLCGAASVAIALVLLLLMHVRPSKAALYIGAGLGASGMSVLGLYLIAALLDLGGLAGEISSLLAMQMGLLGRKLLLQAGLYAVAVLVAGLGLIGLHQRDMRRLCQSRRSRRS